MNKENPLPFASAAPRNVLRNRRRRAVKKGTRPKRAGRRVTRPALDERRSRGRATVSVDQPPPPMPEAPIPGVPAPEASRPSSPDIFRRFKFDPQHCFTYRKSILRTLAESETKNALTVPYLQNQPDLSTNMRTILIDWLVDVHLRFKLKTETLFLGVNVVDRFLSRRQVNRRHLQLIGIVALFISAKYEEIYIPTVNDLDNICANTYTCDQIRRMERKMLQILDFGLTVVTPIHFVHRLLVIFEYELVNARHPHVRRMMARLQLVMQFVLQSSLLYYECVPYRPSLLAAAAALLTGHIVLGRLKWTNVFRHYTGYTREEIRDCSTLLLNCARDSLRENHKFTSIKRKFRGRKRGRIAVWVARKFAEMERAKAPSQ